MTFKEGPEGDHRQEGSGLSPPNFSCWVPGAEFVIRLW